jgi:hypothetical protein
VFQADGRISSLQKPKQNKKTNKQKTHQHKPESQRDTILVVKLLIDTRHIETISSEAQRLLGHLGES